MRAITVIRAIAWIAVVLTGWSLAIAWGTDVAGSGPPPEWKKEVVGGLVLTLITAGLLMISGSGGRQRWLTRGVAASCAAATVFIALSLRNSVMSANFPDLINGPGWPRFCAGAVLALVVSVAALLLPAKKRKVEVGGKKAKRRRAAK